jgi:hypothetical protein
MRACVQLLRIPRVEAQMRERILDWIFPFLIFLGVCALVACLFYLGWLIGGSM